MNVKSPDDLQSLIERREYRSIAIRLAQLEDARGVVSISDLGQDPVGAIGGSPELSIEYDPSPREGCSVYGYYRYALNEPAKIFVHPSFVTDRDSFTIVHEYGHHVQRQHDDWANALYSLPSAARTKFEEGVADAFAAEVLIPADTVAFDSSWLNAEALAAVHSSVRASRSAVAMRASEIAPDNDRATVVVCDRTGTVIFARALGDEVFAPARGRAQPGLASLFVEAASAGGVASGAVVGGLRAASNWVQGDLRGELALDYTGLYAFAVLRSEQKFGRTPTWERDEVECSNPACEEVFTVDASVEICPVCHDPRCPECSTCSCEPPATEVCGSCWMAYSVAEQNGSVVHVCP